MLALREPKTEGPIGSTLARIQVNQQEAHAAGASDDFATLHPKRTRIKDDRPLPLGLLPGERSATRTWVAQPERVRPQVSALV
jgi:hypothetical protein